MATFEAQVEGLTGINIDSSTNPTQTQLTQFLRDGVIDVINRITRINPEELVKFANTTHDDSSGITITGKLLSVTREHDSTDILRECTPILTSDRYNATDPTSLKYRSKYNPGYYILDKKVHTVPAQSGDNNDLVVTQVHYDETITFESDDMQHYPREYIYLVPLYAACKTIVSNMGNKAMNIPSLALPPTPSAPTLSSNSVSITGTAPTYTAPTVAPDFGDANTWINTEEDPEMSGARVQVISTQLQDFQSKMQNELNQFNKENVQYQAILQKDIQDAQLSSNDDAQKLQKYQAELQSYQGEVAKEVQRTQAELGNLNADCQWLQGRYIILKQEYDGAFALMNPGAMQPQQQGER